jgi:hypothetical protein
MRAVVDAQDVTSRTLRATTPLRRRA